MKILKKYDKDTYYEYDSEDVKRYYPDTFIDLIKGIIIYGSCMAIFFGLIELFNFLCKHFS